MVGLEHEKKRQDGPRVLFYSASPESNVVGATAELLLEIDEAQDVEWEKFNRDFRPMAAVRNATTVLYGTAWSDTTLLAQQRAANLAEQVTEVQALGRDLESRLMRASQLAVNLQYFYRLESETEVKLLDVRQTGTNRNNKMQFATVSFIVSVQGSFAQVTNFLTKLQSGRHFCRVTGANFSKSGSGMDGNPAAADMSLALSLEILGQPQ